MQRALGLGQDRPVETGHIANREQVERGVVMIVFQGRGRGQDQVGITRGFVDVQIDADHELQPVQGLLQLPPVGCGQHRVAGHGDQRTNLAFALGEHFLGQGRHRQLP
ncbi:hypothetical protein D3C76_1383950 [compost metagenome]